MILAVWISTIDNSQLNNKNKNTEYRRDIDKNVPYVMRPDIVIEQFREWSRPQDPKCTIINIVLIVQVCIFLEILPKLPFVEPS